MKILHCFFSFKCGGSENMIVDIINEQTKSSKVDLMIVNNVVDEDLLGAIDKNVRCFILGRTPQSRSIWPIIKLNIILLKNKYDVIHIHDVAIIRLILPIFKNIYLTLHTVGIPTTNFNRFKNIFAISETVKAEASSRTNCQIEIIENGVNLDKINKRDNRLPADNFKIVQVGRLVFNVKGQDILIKALGELKNKGVKNVHVYFIGEGKDEIKINSLSKELGIADRVHILCKQSREKIYETLCEYDLMCHPARIEGFGLVIVEGGAANLPVLVPNHGGAYEVIEKGKYGYVFDAENSSDCADKILWIMNNYSETKSVVDRGAEYMSKNYSIKNTVEKYMYYYTTK